MSSSSRKIDACLLVLALGLASCTRPADIAAHDDADLSAAAGAEVVEAEAPDGPAVVPPATVPHAASALAPLATGFDGFGPVAFGAGPQALREAWPGTLDGGPDASEPDACYYLVPQPRPAQGYGTGFMIEGGRFVRVDVDQAGAMAPGGGRIGMAASEIATLYPGQVEELPHKYVEGASYLRVTPDSGPSVLVFELDAQDIVQRWRVGLPPQVDYVEGCG